MHLLDALAAQLVRVQVFVGHVDEAEAVLRWFFLLGLRVKASLEVVQVPVELCDRLEAVLEELLLEHGLVSLCPLRFYRRELFKLGLLTLLLFLAFLLKNFLETLALLLTELRAG